MWIFLPGGLLMPAEFPRDKVDPEFVGPEDDYDLQIRARAISHLEHFIRDYADPLGLKHSAIQKTPGMDYNARIYMTRQDFATAMAQAVVDIDYTKFKPTAERKDVEGADLYKDAKEYHGVLNSIWGTVCRLGSPGGWYGSYHPLSNPSGYHGSYGSEDWKKRYGSSVSRYTGRTLDQALADGQYDLSDDVKDGDALYGSLVGDDEDSYIPSEERQRDIALWSVDGVPASQWPDFLDEYEMGLVKDVYDKEMAKERRSDRRRNRRGRHKKNARQALPWLR